MVHGIIIGGLESQRITSMRGRRRGVERGGRGRTGKAKGFWERGFPFAFFLLLSLSLFAPATQASGYHSSDINIPRPVLLSSSDFDFFA